MTPTHLTPVMPCRSLDELPLVRGTVAAEQILSAWTALWHPALVAAARAMPHWAAAETPPEAPAGHLLLVPPLAEERLGAGWLGEAEAAGGTVLRGLVHRDEMLAAALRQLDGPIPAIDPELVADFLALGFCHFTIEMVTLQMRYSSNLDEQNFEREVLAAADAACHNDAGTARAKLQAAFDLLHSAREYYYSGEAFLLDLCLVAETTLGASLRETLAQGIAADEYPREAADNTAADENPRRLPTSLLISGRVLEEMARREPASLALLRQALESGTAAAVGGEFQELELPLLPLEAIDRQLRKGLAVYQQHLGRQPTVFGRRRFGMTPALPQLLERAGFTGVLHATLDDGRFPAEPAGRVRWQGVDGTTLEALLRVPADAATADAFLRLSQNLSGTLSGDHAATAIFAHWPGSSSPWYRDVRRIARYTTVLGKFVTASEVFERGGYTGQEAQHQADQYHSPYLRQEVERAGADPISRWVRYYARRATAEAIQTLDTLSQLAVGGSPPVSPLPPGEGPGARVSTSPFSPRGRGVGGEGAPSVSTAALADVDDSLTADPAGDAALDDRLQKELQRSLDGFARSVSRPVAAETRGVLVANPWAFPHRFCLELPELAARPAAAEPVRWAAEVAGRKTAVVDVPPLGFAWIGPAEAEEATTTPKRGWGVFRHRADPPLAELLTRGPASARGAVLRNEFFEVHLDPHTGAIRGVVDPRLRGPRLAQQIALRLPGATDDAEDAYSIMAADDIAISSPGPVLGEAVVRGRLTDRQGHRVAGFRQTTRVWRGSRIIELEIELAPEQPLGDDPWNSYYATRLAWADPTAKLYRSVNQAIVASDAIQMEATHVIELRGEKLRTALLCGGLPYHRRRGAEKLDTLLLVRGETARRFRLGLGIDLPQPMAAATAFLAPRSVQPGALRGPHASGWLFHLDAKGVLATHWEPLLEGGGPRAEGGGEQSPRTASGGSFGAAGGSSGPADGQIAGFRVRLLETDGRQIALGLRSFRTVASAQKIGHGDRPVVDLPIEGDRIAVDLGPYEWAEVESRF